MRIESSTTNAALSGVQRPRGPRGGDPAQAMQKTAELLGMTSDELRSALDNGSTLSSLAETKGVSHADLVASIKEGLAAMQQTGGDGDGDAVQATSATQKAESLDEIAENIANGVRPARPQGPPPGRPPAGVNEPDTEALSNVADTLGMTSEDLLSALQSGTTLADLATQQGVSASDVLSAVKPGMVLKMRL